MKALYIILMVLSLTLNCSGQSIKPFEDFKNELRSHWTKGHHSESIEILLANRSNYPADTEQHLITYYLGLLYLEIDDYEKCFEVFNNGFDRFFFFSFWPSHLSKIEQHPDGKQIIDRNHTNKTIYQKEASVSYEVILPENYNSKIAYPLLYFLHGNNSNLKHLKRKFQNIKLFEDVILVLAQSSYARSNYSFDWIDSSSSKNSLLKMHTKVLKNHYIDSTKIIVGGFSNGGRMAIDVFINKIIPTLGFIAFNPSNITITSNTINKGKGAIITGETDYMLAKQITMVNTLYDLSFPLRLVVLPDHGHDYPETFAQELNKSIGFILKKNE